MAHRLVYGYGHLTWEWEKRIRGFFHPLLFTFPFAFLRLFGLDSPNAVIAAPKILQVKEIASWAVRGLVTDIHSLKDSPIELDAGFPGGRR